MKRVKFQTWLTGKYFTTSPHKKYQQVLSYSWCSLKIPEKTKTTPKKKCQTSWINPKKFSCPWNPRGPRRPLSIHPKVRHKWLCGAWAVVFCVQGFWSCGILGWKVGTVGTIKHLEIVGSGVILRPRERIHHAWVCWIGQPCFTLTPSKSRNVTSCWGRITRDAFSL